MKIARFESTILEGYWLSGNGLVRINDMPDERLQNAINCLERAGLGGNSKHVELVTERALRATPDP